MPVSPFSCRWPTRSSTLPRDIPPESEGHIINTVPGPALGDYGERFSLPIARTKGGRESDISRIRPNEDQLYNKYLFFDDLREGSAIIHEPSAGETVVLSWSVEKVP